MAHEQDWQARLAEQVGRRVRKIRDQQKMTAQQLAGRCAEIGVPLDRTVLAKLERGRRQTLTLGEVFVLARALDVPPLRLMFGLAPGEPDGAEILPGQVAAAWDAAKWVTGEGPFPLDNPQPLFGGDDTISLYRDHDEHERDAALAAARVEYAERQAAQARTESERSAFGEQSRAWVASLRQAEASLAEVREEMQRQGLTPPQPLELPPPGRTAGGSQEAGR